MGSAHQVSPVGACDKGVAEKNQHVQNEHQEVREGIDGEDRGISEDEESRMNEVVRDLSNKERGDVHPLAPQATAQRHQQQPLGTIVRWERFLPVRTLKVLLVESDDSTRHVVSALLRNCSYEVTAAANGLQAWKILEDLTNHIDLVLTEVVMPYLSGIALLSKIMSHKTCKNIPVIMMSSSDSMGTVFKCLSKGAVDFLVKPIRKNELKNLWQHVWRRCHSSSDSGSESGIQTQKSVKSKSTNDSDNNTGSNDDGDDENGSSGMNARDGSDNGSGTQSSWTKRAVEVESPEHISPSNQLADQPDSTCAQVIHPKHETVCNDWAAMSANKEFQGQRELPDDSLGKDLEIGVPRSTELEQEIYSTEKICSKITDANLNRLPEGIQKNENILGLDSKKTSDEQCTQAADLIGAITNCPDIQTATTVIQTPKGFSKIPEKQEKSAYGSTDSPSLELSLKRLRSITADATSNHDDRNVLRRSEQSAFSRYHTSAAYNQAPTEYGGSCCPGDNTSGAARAESMYRAVFSSSRPPLKQGSNGSSNNNEMGSTAMNIFASPAAQNEKTASTLAVKFSQNSSAFHPVQILPSTNHQLLQEKTGDPIAAAAKGEALGMQHQVQVQHHHHHYHHHHVHVHNLQKQPQPSPDRSDLPLKNVAAAAPQCGSSNVFLGPVEGNAANYSINRSKSGSNHCSNGQNGSSTAIKAGVNTESASGIADQSGPSGGDGSGSGSASGVDRHRVAQREAALKKFRQKRKERNFGKKVRYQSRKRLAEQRPRVRGQFVRQNVHEQIGREAGR